MERFLEFGGEVHPAPVSSPGSTPQGDPLAMLGMLTILLAPARRISAEYPTTTLSLFADDRTA
eukprot:12016327-Alexandrium_andersonii.AAC.1